MMESSSISPDHIWWITNFFAVTATRCEPVFTVEYSDELFAVFSATNSISGMSTSTGRYAVGSVIWNVSMSGNTRDSRRAASHSSPTYWAPTSCEPYPDSAVSIAAWIAAPYVRASKLAPRPK